jgi:hypothetical protein
VSNHDGLEKRGVITYELGRDFTKEDIDKWKAQIALWISQTQKKEEKPTEKAEHILACAVSGTKLNGEAWPGVESFNLRTRIKSLTGGFDIVTGKGRRPATFHGRNKRKEKEKSKSIQQSNSSKYIEISEEEFKEARERHKELLFQEFPHLDNEIYEAQVNALCDAIVKLESIASAFITAGPGKELESLISIRNSLQSEINNFMKLLRIHPSQIKEKIDDYERGDIGGLIAEWEEYGELAEVYEKVDAIQELIQTIRQVEQLRVDGSKQLSDYLLWHKTGTKPTEFKCACGRDHTLYDGFTKEELYAAAEAAYEVFGFGLKPDEE